MLRNSINSSTNCVGLWHRTTFSCMLSNEVAADVMELDPGSGSLLIGQCCKKTCHWVSYQVRHKPG